IVPIFFRYSRMGSDACDASRARAASFAACCADGRGMAGASGSVRGACVARDLAVDAFLVEAEATPLPFFLDVTRVVFRSRWSRPEGREAVRAHGGLPRRPPYHGDHASAAFAASL